MGFKDYSSYLSVVVACVIPYVGAYLGSLPFKSSITDWYDHLVLPDFKPPNYVFGPVWAILYFLMGFASYRVWKTGGGFSGEAKVALWLYIIQLLLNWAWSPLFFGLHMLKASAIEIIVLAIAIKFTTIFFFRIDKIAGFLMIPYMMWVMFASYLNFWIYQHNTYDN